ncbi:PfaD family polyunsaturated fatty acid/polyketide biosynthesis protein [Lentzea kentuckyensis]|uniref:PfaD family polyunsaturated fatty acid/polyketide biosynthesis protein n=1 Tax=Lentzea kentuckyensis TaxID=360086 RepID=UPI000A3CEC10|nr:PfaD family polyunsaturated fatty acid/polyketide biosynthesis protein [Lentzea kentuckyensis]
MTLTTDRPTTRDGQSMRNALMRLDLPCYVVRGQGRVGLTTERPADDSAVIAVAAPLTADRLGSAAFRKAHGVRYAYMCGAMAGGIASPDLVIAIARAGSLGTYGAAGVLPTNIEKALQRFRDEIPDLPYAANLIHSPSEDALERDAVELYLKYGVRCVEASAFMALTPHVVRYRVAGLCRDQQGRPVARNRLVAKVSRSEVATHFLRPAPASVVADLVAHGLATPEQAELAEQVPMADDITVEADSGGHTDRRPMGALLPTILGLRDAEQARHRWPIRVGAAGGLGTPASLAAVYAMGADYAVTGSVNQSCVESGTSDAARRLLAEADVADCEMAPAADMFELGVDLQVLRKGTLFPMRAKKLYELYRTYEGVEALPVSERLRLEQQIFRRPLDEVWADVVAYFTRRDPAQLERAAADPRRRMALIFRWYLGMASRWAVTGEPDRTQDYQIWCGPAMGAFNDWVRGTYLEDPARRAAADVATHLMRGAAYTSRVWQLKLAGVRLPASCTTYRPTPLSTEPGES